MNGEHLIQSVQDALRLLAELGAPPFLVRHHELVLEAAGELLAGWPGALAVPFDREQVLWGAALHDAGKIQFSEEMNAPGHAHEEAGEALLLRAGVSPVLARFCRSHARWSTMEVSLEELLVALCDKLWKGKRDEPLEQTILARVSGTLGLPLWQVYSSLDPLFENIASLGDDRLARSQS